MNGELQKAEANRLHALEIVIEEGKQTFVEVGNALAEIRDGKLYRAEFKTFEAYCKERWGWAKAYCNHVVRAAEVVKSLPTETATMVASERQARELAKVEPSRRADVVEKAGASGKVTAASIKEAAKEVPPFRPDAVAAGAEAKQDSEKLWRLKQAWKAASKKDRTAFLGWVKEKS